MLFTLKQRAFRCALHGQIDHSKLPIQISGDFLVSKYQWAIQYGCVMTYMRFSGAANGNYEPIDEEFESALKATGWLYSGRLPGVD